jgi:RNA polymerase-binding transcription factor
VARTTAGATAGKKPPARRSPAKKPAATKAAAKKPRATKAAATKTTAAKAPAKQPPAKNAAPKNTTTTKGPAKKTTATKTPAKKTTATKTAATKTAATRTPAKKAPAGTSSAKGPTKKTAKSTGSRPSAEAAARKLAVKADEDPWTAAELEEVRSELDADRARLRVELNLAEHELQDLMRDAGDGAGNDQADIGSTTFERDHEMSLANNARDMLAQTERALDRIDDGTYGVCESCGQPIGKMRVMAFPRATLCLSCKQREERR